jgi:hypothetical protein
MKKYYAKDSVVAVMVISGGKLTKQELDGAALMFSKLGMKEVSEKEYKKIQATLPTTKEQISIRVGKDGKLVTEQSVQ